MRKQTKIVAALSATTLLALGASAMTFAAGWDNSTGTWQYLDNNNEAVTSAWRRSGDYWFYLGSDGSMVTDAIIENDNNDDFYYVNADGAMVTNQWVALENDDSDVDVDYRWYYFGSDGKAYRNTTSDGKLTSSQIKTINGRKYAFDADGRMLFGWVNADTLDITTDFDSTDWQYDEDTYYFGSNDDGAAASGWIQLTVTDDDDESKNTWFWADGNGKLKKDGKRTINGSVYYFDTNGAMMEDFLDVESSGNVVEADESSAQIVYTNGDGATRKNRWIWAVPTEDFDQSDYDDDEYSWWYAQASGKFVTNKLNKKINGRYYAFDSKGRMLTGFVTQATTTSTPQSVSADDIEKNDLLHLGSSTDEDILDFQTAWGATNEFYYYSSDEADGSRKTGYQTVAFDDDTYQMYFNTSSGKAMNGYVSKIKKFVKNGVVLQADADENRYGAIYVSSATLSAADAQFNGTQTDIVLAELNGAGTDGQLDVLASGDNIVLVNSSGALQKNLKNAKDSNDHYWFTDNNGYVTYYSEVELTTSKTKAFDYDSSTNPNPTGITITYGNGKTGTYYIKE